jgi:hypothetical protein
MGAALSYFEVNFDGEMFANPLVKSWVYDELV